MSSLHFNSIGLPVSEWEAERRIAQRTLVVEIKIEDDCRKRGRNERKKAETREEEEEGEGGILNMHVSSVHKPKYRLQQGEEEEEEVQERRREEEAK